LGEEPASVLDDGPAEVLSSDWGGDLSRGLASGARMEPFDSFYLREMPRLVAMARGLCGFAVADDIAQESMLAAYRRWAEVGSYDRPEAWVRRVCANQATSVLRRRAAEARAVLRLASAPAPAAVVQEDTAEFWAQVRRLPRRQAQAAALRYVYDLSVPEIAVTMGCSEGSVKVHLSRARAALADRFNEEVSS
jgi:RNA polymerase sigma factor (sigma-70 family)